MPETGHRLYCLRYTTASQVLRFTECECEVKLPILPNVFFKISMLSWPHYLHKPFKKNVTREWRGGENYFPNGFLGDDGDNKEGMGGCFFLIGKFDRSFKFFDHKK